MVFPKNIKKSMSIVNDSFSVVMSQAFLYVLIFITGFPVQMCYKIESLRQYHLIRLESVQQVLASHVFYRI